MVTALECGDSAVYWSYPTYSSHEETHTLSDWSGCDMHIFFLMVERHGNTHDMGWEFIKESPHIKELVRCLTRPVCLPQPGTIKHNRALHSYVPSNC